LRTGAALGLTELARSTATKPESAISATNGQPQPNATYTPQARIYKVDSEDLLLTPGRGVEFKYHMQRGAVMVYSWKASGQIDVRVSRRARPKTEPRLLRQLRTRRQSRQD
jgi:hypothetical protein